MHIIRHRVDADQRHSTASRNSASRTVILARHPILPGQTRPGRKESPGGGSNPELQHESMLVCCAHLWLWKVRADQC